MSQTKLSNQIKQTKLLPKEVEVITACLLGDGSLSKSGKHYRLRIEHQQAHKEYVEWKYEFLKRLCISEIQYVPVHSSYRFGTVGHPEITEFRTDWYPEDIKEVPDLDLTPLMIAIWFMDDGTKQRDTIDISVHNFSKQSGQILQDQLLTFKIKTTINSDSKGNRLRVRKESYDAFKKLVKPYIVNCMAYKLP